MFTVQYSDENAKRDWLQLHQDMPEDWARAAKLLTERPMTPTERCFRLATANLWTKVMGRATYPQWAYVISNELQVHYFIDPRKHIVWLRAVVKHKIKGVAV